MRFKSLAAFGAAVFLVGCGGSGVNLPPGVTDVITRGGDARFSVDSLMLASRAAESPWIPIDLATTIEADLARIRTAYPALAGLHARPISEPKTLLITLKADAPAQAAWRTGTLLSADGGLNQFLIDYNANKVALLRDDTFVVTFDQWLNTNKLAPVAASASPNVRSASENYLVGDGDQIRRTDDGAGVRTFLFQKGWGDCTAGCIYRHTWMVEVAADNSLRVNESGAPLP